MVDAGVGHHGVHRGVRIVCHELRAKMLFPDRYQILIGHRFSPLDSHGERSGAFADFRCWFPRTNLLLELFAERHCVPE
jgi:hypothetical protein